ncbi:MAG: DUF6065 family protein [Bosea sp. (in: a-proteobacteria)]
MRADKAALGTLPTAAFQYCEPSRLASAFGWYIFPANDIQLRWDGAEVFHAVGGQWERLVSAALDDNFLHYWDEHAPEDLKGCSPPSISATFVPGIVQIWSGLLVSTAKDWSILVGPPANLIQNRSFSCFEGIIETDAFRPCPLFINIRLQCTADEIFIPRNKPLFQIRPLLRQSYADHVFQHREFAGLAARDGDRGSMTPEDWNGYRSTVRRADEAQSRCPGTYAAARRKRAKQEVV